MNQTNNCVAVAISGGADSTALFYATAKVAKKSGLRVVGLHVHHGLQTQADGWVKHLEDQVALWASNDLPVSLRVAYLTDKPPQGSSIEAWAHNKRHEALAKMAKEEGASILLLAHHSRDQAETVLLQALRGAGAHGLAAMPEYADRDGVAWARPWLKFPPEMLKRYVEYNELSHIEDPSNKDTTYDRNKLRNDVWPILSKAFPNIDKAMSLVAKQAWGYASISDEVAADDLVEIVDGEKLLIDQWLCLSTARRKSSLKLWLRKNTTTNISERFLNMLCCELCFAVAAKWSINNEVEVRLYRDKLSVHKHKKHIAPPQHPQNVSWVPAIVEEWQELPMGIGWVRLKQVSECGVSVDILNRTVWRSRSGGERFALSKNTPSHSLKKQYQSQSVPTWKRQGPLLWFENNLVWVPGLGIDAGMWETGSSPQYFIEWVNDPSCF